MPGDWEKISWSILNDNQMSISKNVGAISSYLNRTFTGEFYAKMREETGQLLGKIPHIGLDVQKMGAPR